MKTLGAFAFAIALLAAGVVLKIHGFNSSGDWSMIISVVGAFVIFDLSEGK